MPANLESSAVATGLERSVFISIPKKDNAKECSNYHKITLISHTSWRRKWQPTPVFLPGESLGQRSLAGCHLWGRTESDMIERLSSSSSTKKELMGCKAMRFEDLMKGFTVK